MLINRLEPPGTSRRRDGDRRALLIAMQGETHILGLRMVGKLMDAVGWDVTFEEQRSAEDCAQTAAEKWIGVVGVTVGLPSGLERAARTIAVVRNASMNRNLAVLVGGNAFTDHPELVAQVEQTREGLMLRPRWCWLPIFSLVSHLRAKLTALRSIHLGSPSRHPIFKSFESRDGGILAFIASSLSSPNN